MNVIPFVHALDYESIPGEVITAARRQLLDLVGVAAAGSRTELARIISAHAVSQFGGVPAVRLLFDGRNLPLPRPWHSDKRMIFAQPTSNLYVSTPFMKPLDWMSVSRKPPNRLSTACRFLWRQRWFTVTWGLRKSLT